MNEEDKTIEKPDTPKEDNADGDKSELAKETDAANAAAERMEKATEELNAAEAKRRLGGTSEGGIESKPKLSKEEQEAKDRVNAYGQATGSDWANEKKDE